MPRQILSWLLEAIGMVVGGAVGYWAFFWFARNGFYALMLPGGLLGLGCSLFSANRSNVRGIICAVAGLALTVYTDWGFERLNADPSFPYFVTHYHQLGPVTLLLTGLGTAIAYWMGKDSGYMSFARKPARQEPSRVEE